VAAAAGVLATLAAGKPDVWDSHATTVRIGFAANNIARGTSLLLQPFIALLRTSPKAEANVVEYATGVYETPPPADGGPRPGLAFLRDLLSAVKEEERARKRAALIALLETEGLPTAVGFVDGLMHGHTLLLGKFLAAHSLSKYRVALDVVQHDTPGSMHGHVLYRREGGRWVQEAACKLNYDTFLSDHLLELLETVLDSKAIVAACEKTSPIADECTAFYGGAKMLRENILGFKPQGKDPIRVAHEELRNDGFYQANGVPEPEAFFKLLNAHHHLLGFDNGILDMERFKFHFGDAAPEDAYVSFSCGYDFPGDEDGNPMTEEMRAAMDEVTAAARPFHQPILTYRPDQTAHRAV
jgi:hypothetical protein